MTALSTAVTDEGVEKLQQILPKCKINHDSRRSADHLGKGQSRAIPARRNRNRDGKQEAPTCQ